MRMVSDGDLEDVAGDTKSRRGTRDRWEQHRGWWAIEEVGEEERM